MHTAVVSDGIQAIVISAESVEIKKSDYLCFDTIVFIGIVVSDDLYNRKYIK